MADTADFAPFTLALVQMESQRSDRAGNRQRLIAWLMEMPLAKTRISPLAVFRQKSAPISAAT